MNSDPNIETSLLPKKKIQYHPGKYYKNIQKKNTMKYQEFLRNEKKNKIAYFLFFVLSNIMTIFSLVLYVFETYSETNKEKNIIKINKVLKIQNFICGIYFSFEYILIYTTNQQISIKKSIFSFDSFFDIITTIPSFVIFFSDNFILISIIKIFKILRCLRILRTMNVFKLINSNFDNKYKVDFIHIIIVFLCTFIIAGGLLVGLNDLSENAFSMKNLHFFDGLYVFFVTATTLGFGDIYPTNTYSRISIIILIVLFMSVTSKEISKALELYDNARKYKKYNFKDHIIIFINDNINIYEILYEIKRRFFNIKIIIISEHIKNCPSKEFPYNKVYVLNSKIIDNELLERVNTRKAKCIFIFSKKNMQNEKLEKQNEFLIIKITQFNPKIPIYIQKIINSKNIDNRFDLNNHSLVKNLYSLSDLKSLIFSTSMKNPGYLTFIQNLIFNNSLKPDLFNNFDTLMKSYFYGAENTIVIEKFPSYFIGHNFFDVIRIIYSTSIQNYFEKIMTEKVVDEIKPILLIGVYQCNKEFGDKILFLSNHIEIDNNSYGIFISYNRNKYVKKVLEKFNHKNTFHRVKKIKKEQIVLLIKRILLKEEMVFLFQKRIILIKHKFLLMKMMILKKVKK